MYREMLDQQSTSGVVGVHDTTRNACPLFSHPDTNRPTIDADRPALAPDVDYKAYLPSDVIKCHWLPMWGIEVIVLHIYHSDVVTV